MKYKFFDEVDLGKAVDGNFKPFCKLTKKMDVPQERDIVGDFSDANYPGLAGKKWSRLCGFTFKGKDGRYFQFVFVPKLKGTLSRNQKALSGWYCWTLSPTDKDNKQVTSIIGIKNAFGFDINKFVHSDVFDKYVKVFKDNILYALSHQVAELMSRPETSFDDYKELERNIKAVRDSVQLIDEVKQVVTLDNMYDDTNSPEYARVSAPKVGHAKIAYNADKTYDLRNIDKKSQEEERKKKALDAIASKLDAAKVVDIPASKPEKRSKGRVIADPSLKYKFGGGRTKKADAEIFDKYDDYDSDDYR